MIVDVNRVSRESRSPWRGRRSRVRLATSIDRPAHDLATEEIEHGAAVDLALARGMLGDVGQPERVGTIGGEVALDEVLFGRARSPGSSCAFSDPGGRESQFSHDREHQLLVHDHVVFLLQRLAADADHAVGAAAALVDVGDERRSGAAGGSRGHWARGICARSRRCARRPRPRQAARSL
jgi:hypothetical protein